MIAKLTSPGPGRRQPYGDLVDVYSNAFSPAYKLQFNPKDKTPKYKQIVQSVITDIERGVLKTMSNYHPSAS